MYPKSHHRLDAWKRSMALVTTVYEATAAFPKHELYGLTSQMRRAAVSVPSNIAEGAARETTPELLRFLYTARGSLAELETQSLLAHSLGYLSDPDSLSEEIDRVSEILAGLIRHVKSRTGKPGRGGRDRVAESTDGTEYGVTVESLLDSFEGSEDA